MNNDANDQLLERPLPNSAESERAILGAIILDNGFINQAIELLHPEDFYVPSHRRTFLSMIALSERGSEINPILVGEELRRDGSLESVGGLTFISNLTYGLPHFANIAHYAKIVRDKSLLRQLVKAANKITSEALEEEREAEVIVDHAEQVILAIGNQRRRSDGNGNTTQIVTIPKLKFSGTTWFGRRLCSTRRASHRGRSICPTCAILSSFR